MPPPTTGVRTAKRLRAEDADGRLTAPHFVVSFVVSFVDSDYDSDYDSVYDQVYDKVYDKV
jgi:hypothetical protein